MLRESLTSFFSRQYNAYSSPLSIQYRTLLMGPVRFLTLEMQRKPGFNQPVTASPGPLHITSPRDFLTPFCPDFGHPRKLSVPMHKKKITTEIFIGLGVILGVNPDFPYGFSRNFLRRNQVSGAGSCKRGRSVSSA